MSRRPSSLVAQRNTALVQRICALKAEHPFWGYRRIWAYLRFVEQLPWYTKTIVGYHAGIRCTAQHWLLALDMAGNRQFPAGVQGRGLSLMSDHGGQPTSMALMRACGTLGSPQAFTSETNPKGNADTERMMRTLKEECLWLHEWTCPFALASVLETWIAAYNEHYLHSTLGYKSPRQFEREYHTRHSPQFAVA